MKHQIDNLKTTYQLCASTGSIKEKVKDEERTKALKFVAERGLAFIIPKMKDVSRESTDWTFIFREYYESLRSLMEAYLLLEGIEAEKHQCTNAYICFKHPELELDWEFLETVRLIRNGINYRGRLLMYEDWKPLKLKFELHVSVLKTEIESNLEQNKKWH